MTCATATPVPTTLIGTSDRRASRCSVLGHPQPELDECPFVGALAVPAATRAKVRDVKLVLSNAPPDRADEIARQLVEERLAACVNLLPIRSVYRWKGAIAQEPEVTLLIKVSAERVDALVQRLRALHPYELPEILAFDVDAARSLPEYITWVRSECTPE
jgi:periplasmic divalent cation tolerance protein